MPATQRDLTYQLNRLANTLVNGRPTLADAAAANKWAGTSGLGVEGALNKQAGRTDPKTFLSMRAVCNLLGGTTDQDEATALASASSDVLGVEQGNGTQTANVDFTFPITLTGSVYLFHYRNQTLGTVTPVGLQRVDDGSLGSGRLSIWRVTAPSPSLTTSGANALVSWCRDQGEQGPACRVRPQLRGGEPHAPGTRPSRGWDCPGAGLLRLQQQCGVDRPAGGAGGVPGYARGGAAIDHCCLLPGRPCGGWRPRPVRHAAHRGIWIRLVVAHAPAMRDH